MLPNTMSGIIAHISTFVIRVLQMSIAAPSVAANESASAFFDARPSHTLREKEGT
jgi:hypothetical protein